MYPPYEFPAVVRIPMPNPYVFCCQVPCQDHGDYDGKDRGLDRHSGKPEAGPAAAEWAESKGPKPMNELTKNKKRTKKSIIELSNQLF